MQLLVTLTIGNRYLKRSTDGPAYLQTEERNVLSVFVLMRNDSFGASDVFSDLHTTKNIETAFSRPLSISPSISLIFCHFLYLSISHLFFLYISLSNTRTLSISLTWTRFYLSFFHFLFLCPWDSFYLILSLFFCHFHYLSISHFFFLYLNPSLSNTFSISHMDMVLPLSLPSFSLRHFPSLFLSSSFCFSNMDSFYLFLPFFLSPLFLSLSPVSLSLSLSPPSLSPSLSTCSLSYQCHQ